MKKQRLDPEFDWEWWRSDEQDLHTVDATTVGRIVLDMFLIREFEHRLLALQKDGCVWGPVHSSVGQEAVAAAAIAALRKTDKIAGTHRAHHQFLAKAMKYALADDWDPSSDDLPDEGLEVLKRTMAEILGLSSGYCGGRGGSMHLRHGPAGVIGTNAIVAGGIPLATGTAFAERFNRTGNVVVCFFGDGAINQGSFHEACNLAGIWGLPIIYFVENNSYAVGTSVEQACAVEHPSLRASAYDMKGRIVHGTDPLAVYQVVAEAADDIRGGGRPYLVEAKCYRSYHHAGDRPGSAYGYRSASEEAEWAEKDAFVTLPAALTRAGLLEGSAIARLEEVAREAVAQAVDYCTVSSTPRAVRTDLWPAPESCLEGVRSDDQEWSGVVFREREDYADLQNMRYLKAISAVTGRWLENDPRVFVLGEEVANFGGGAYGATRDLPAQYPDRVLNTPISEAGFVGLACGAAAAGLRPIVEIMFPDFSLVAADQLFNQIAKIRYMYGGSADAPLVVRTRVAIGCGYGAQHSMDPVGLYALFPGWRIVVPSDSFDYIGLFNSAMRSRDPVLIVEHHSLYNRRFPAPKQDLDYFVRFGKARVVETGSSLTAIAYGAMVHRCAALRQPLSERGTTVELIDLRSVDLPTIDYRTIGESLSKTGSAVVVEEAPTSHSIGAAIAAGITERYFERLNGPVLRANSRDVPSPVSHVLEAAAMISDADILTAMTSAAERGAH